MTVIWAVLVHFKICKEIQFNMLKVKRLLVVGGGTTGPKMVALVLGLLVWLPVDAGLILPPKDKIAMGLLEELKDECLQVAKDANAVCALEMEAKDEYQICRSVFDRMAQNSRTPLRIFFPKCSNFQGELEHMSLVLNENAAVLGGCVASVLHWPEAPASLLSIDWTQQQHPVSYPNYQQDPCDMIETTKNNCEQWVENTLCKHGLCPYTKSMNLGAIGLESFGIQSGRVILRHACDPQDELTLSSETSYAAVLASLFWRGVGDLIEKPETEVSTFLLCAPSFYDDDFQAFYTVLDNLIDKAGRFSFSNVGRVWFHPKYTLSEVGYSKGGHTLPLDVVDSYMEDYLMKHPGVSRPEWDDMVRAHDQTRQTPHAIVNLLRGKQLMAAKANEQSRKHVYARNIIKLLDVEKDKLFKGTGNAKARS